MYIYVKFNTLITSSFPQGMIGAVGPAQDSVEQTIYIHIYTYIYICIIYML